MSTRSLFTSESFNALSVTSAGEGAEVSGAPRNCDWTEVPLCRFLPAVFCFLMGGAIEELLCMPDATTTCEVGTAIMGEAAGAGVGAMATAVFFTVFLGDSEEIGTLLSSYNFLLTVLLI